MFKQFDRISFHHRVKFSLARKPPRLVKTKILLDREMLFFTIFKNKRNNLLPRCSQCSARVELVANYISNLLCEPFMIVGPQYI